MALRAGRIALLLVASLWLSLPACRPQDTKEQELDTATTTSVSDSLIPSDRVAIPDTLRYAVKPREWYGYWMMRTDTLVQDTLIQTSHVQQYYRKTVRTIHPDGRIELIVQIDTLIASFAIPDTAGNIQRFAYDSRSSTDRENPGFAHLTALLGTEVRMLVTPDGRIDSVFGLSAVIQRLRQLSSDTLPEQLNPMLERQVEEQMYRPLQQEYLPFPTSVLDTARTWSHEYPDMLASIFPIRNIAEYHIVGIRSAGNRKALEIRATLRSHPQRRRLQEGRLRAELQRESLGGTGRILVDLEQGYTVTKSVHVQTRFEVILRDTANRHTERFRHNSVSYVQFRLTQRGWLKN
ncbi:MAG: DUF6263 family protein [Candidatus Kapabacteria bacterium]|nr:DUF6263 family protein [Candidatus Kapabacteria bacterium]MCS7169002.1 DUF6263 family protein [Candidatus Kapabacteria bacterium]MDW7997257.1 DUF6263 family protein [Bacteroidota bacterium]MDW8224764.1 DUF6263 family protein [Bacteroidota bacterium]